MKLTGQMLPQFKRIHKTDIRQVTGELHELFRAAIYIFFKFIDGTNITIP